jgi:D-glycero-D-manno-heptose 1,7-bisphosphate phosphatase
MLRKGILFDRDGTLIVDKVYLNDPDAIEFLPGAFEALRALRDGGFAFAVATNQSGLARQVVQIENLHEIHRRIESEFARNGIFFSGFYYAPYSVESRHWMRKPNPGMLQAAARDHGFDLARSWMVGDRLTDAEAGRRAGMRTLILTGLDDPDRGKYEPPTATASGLIEAAQRILEHGDR